MVAQSISSSEKNQLSIDLHHQGFCNPDLGVYTRLVQPGWMSWVSFPDWKMGLSTEILFGICNVEYTEKIEFALQAYSANLTPLEHNHYRRPIFIISLELAMKQYPNLDFRIGIGPLDKASNVLDLILTSLEPYLTRSMTFDSCLECLELFSKNLPLYLTSKLVLLRLLGKVSEFEFAATQWLSLRKNLGLVELDQAFIERLRA